uniref:Uncharacterized protein n=1 Tax=Sipha flava TaxID=143950 RepID=A0A2S2QQP0_9HEMI
MTHKNCISKNIQSRSMGCWVERCKINDVIQIVTTFTNNIRVRMSNGKYNAEFCNPIQMTRYRLIMQIFTRCTAKPVPKNIAQFVRWHLFCFDHFLSLIFPYYEMKTNTNNRCLIYARDSLRAFE